MARKLTPDAVLTAAIVRMSAPWIWGRADCCTAAADIFDDLHGVDLAALWRGRWSSAWSARRVIAQAGGWLALAEQVATVAGLVRCDDEPGAIGLHPKGGAMICIGAGRWAMKSETGLVIQPQARRAWTCPKP